MSLLQSLRRTLKPEPAQNDQPDIDPIQKRISPHAYTLLSENLKKGNFLKHFTVRMPKAGTMNNAGAHYKQERNIWKQVEEYRIRQFTLTQEDYDIITTNESIVTAYYVLEEDVKNTNMQFPFAVLQNFSLVHSVLVPQEQVNPQSSGTPNKHMVSAYLFDQEFIRLLYECIMLRTVMGSNFEYTLEDDLLDYEQEDDEDE